VEGVVGVAPHAQGYHQKVLSSLEGVRGAVLVVLGLAVQEGTSEEEASASAQQFEG
jgi:hypothetical protein